MITVLLFAGLVLSIILISLEKEDWVVAYETNEMSAGDAQAIFYLLKGNHIKASYSYKMNKVNFSFRFNKYQEGVLMIKVHKKDARIAKDVLLHYNILQRQIERSIVQDI